MDKGLCVWVHVQVLLCVFVCVCVYVHVHSGWIYKGNGQTSFCCTFYLNYRATFLKKRMKRIHIRVWVETSFPQRLSSRAMYFPVQLVYRCFLKTQCTTCDLMLCYACCGRGWNLDKDSEFLSLKFSGVNKIYMIKLKATFEEWVRFREVMRKRCC